MVNEVVAGIKAVAPRSRPPFADAFVGGIVNASVRMCYRALVRLGKRHSWGVHRIDGPRPKVKPPMRYEKCLLANAGTHKDRRPQSKDRWPKAELT